MDRKPGNKIELPNQTAAVAAAPPWIELPEDVTANILLRLDAVEILDSAQKVCTTWRKVCQDPAIWRVIDLENRHDAEVEFDLICRCAVDRSRGQLLDLSITCFGEDALLNYVADRSSHLRRLTLADCEISRTALTEAIKKLPKLEELHLITLALLHGKDVETIGISCPLLKSFTLNQHWSEPEFSDNELTEGDYYYEYALAIGKTMSNLRHLRLIAIRVKNEGLEAVLDGCPHLESLDLRKCFGLDLHGDLSKRCCEQIKDLRRPSDSISDLEWPNKLFDDSWDDSLSSYSRSSFSDSSDGDLDGCEFGCDCDYDHDYDDDDDDDGYDYDYDYS